MDETAAGKSIRRLFRVSNRKVGCMRVRTRRGSATLFRRESKTANRIIAVSACLLASIIACSQAGAEVLASRYAVSLSGVRIGEAIVHTTVDAKRYKVEVSADVGSLLNNTRVQGEASGSRSGPKLTPDRFHLVTSDGKESAVDFAAARGAKADAQLRGLLDPLSALLAASLRPSSASAAPCDRVLPIIMSRVRFDASLHPAASDPLRRSEARSLPDQLQRDRARSGRAPEHPMGSGLPETDQAFSLAGRAALPADGHGHGDNRSRGNRDFGVLTTSPKRVVACVRLDLALLSAGGRLPGRAFRRSHEEPPSVDGIAPLAPEVDHRQAVEQAGLVLPELLPRLYRKNCSDVGRGE